MYKCYLFKLVFSTPVRFGQKSGKDWAIEKEEVTSNVLYSFIVDEMANKFGEDIATKLRNNLLTTNLFKFNGSNFYFPVNRLFMETIWTQFYKAGEALNRSIYCFGKKERFSHLLINLRVLEKKLKKIKYVSMEALDKIFELLELLEMIDGSDAEINDENSAESFWMKLKQSLEDFTSSNRFSFDSYERTGVVVYREPIYEEEKLVKTRPFFRSALYPDANSGFFGIVAVSKKIVEEFEKHKDKLLKAASMGADKSLGFGLIDYERSEIRPIDVECKVLSDFWDDSTSSNLLFLSDVALMVLNSLEANSLRERDLESRGQYFLFGSTDVLSGRSTHGLKKTPLSFAKAGSVLLKGFENNTREVEVTSFAKVARTAFKSFTLLFKCLNNSRSGMREEPKSVLYMLPFYSKEESIDFEIWRQLGGIALGF